MAPGLIGIGRQIDAMRERWPSFDLIDSGDRRAVWEGNLAPVSRRYRVRIEYEVPRAIENFSIINVQPRVQVLSPVLERHPEYHEGPIPHVYVNRKEPSLPYLCLFDPFNAEWTPADLLAETTVPWTSRYLYFYEGWLLTGTWSGGGRHPTQEEMDGNRQQKAIAQI
jgi:hypothetical protein